MSAELRTYVASGQNGNVYGVHGVNGVTGAPNVPVTVFMNRLGAVVVVPCVLGATLPGAGTYSEDAHDDGCRFCYF